MSCTTLLVGKKATYDGSTFIARNEDSPSSGYSPKKFVVVKPEDQPRKYQSVISKVEIELPDDPMRYTAMPNGVDKEGIWAAAGVNEANVSMTATETLTTNERVLGADPLVKKGIGEEDIVTITLPYIHSAREGVERLGMLHEKYGTYEMNGIAFSDVDEVWWFETIGGHHWIAKRVPDDAYVVMPNQFGIDDFNLEDAFGEQKEHMCSKDLKEFIEDNHLDLSLDGTFHARMAFGSHSDADHVYNTPRAWYMLRYFNPFTYEWDGPHADYKPEDDDLPWSLVPERKITPEDVKYILSSHYQGTPFDPYNNHGPKDHQGAFRPIGINRNNFLSLTQIRPDKPEEVRTILWTAFGSNVFNAFVPFYTNVTTTPDYFANTTDLPTTENFYWANRILGALADSSYHETIQFIERYQLAVAANGNAIIKKYDEMYQKEKKADLEQANEEIADMAKKETYDTLDKVLFVASNNMTNRFSRADG